MAFVDIIIDDSKFLPKINNVSWPFPNIEEDLKKLYNDLKDFNI